jgi:hypothetical protein
MGLFGKWFGWPTLEAVEKLKKENKYRALGMYVENKDCPLEVRRACAASILELLKENKEDENSPDKYDTRDLLPRLNKVSRDADNIVREKVNESLAILGRKAWTSVVELYKFNQVQLDQLLGGINNDSGDGKFIIRKYKIDLVSHSAIESIYLQKLLENKWLVYKFGNDTTLYIAVINKTERQNYGLLTNKLTYDELGMLKKEIVKMINSYIV